MGSFFIRRDNTVKGPFSAQQVAELFKSKQLRANDEVSTSEAGPWRRMALAYRKILVEAENTDDRSDNIVFADAETRNSSSEDSETAETLDDQASDFEPAEATYSVESDAELDSSVNVETTEDFDYDELEYHTSPALPPLRRTSRKASKRSTSNHNNRGLSVGICVTLLLVAIAGFAVWQSGVKYVSGTGFVPQPGDDNVSANRDALPKAAPGRVRAVITWKYNEVQGHRPDVGATLILIPTDFNRAKYQQNTLIAGSFDLFDLVQAEFRKHGIYAGIVGGTGETVISQLPPGTYNLVVTSGNTRSDTTDADVKAKSTAIKHILEVAFERVFNSVSAEHHTVITVWPNDTTVYNYDFGLTAF